AAGFLHAVISAREEQFHDLLGASAEFGRSKQDFESRMGVLAGLIADVLYLQEGAPEKIVNIDIREQLQKLADLASVDRLLRMAEFIRFIESSLKSNVNRQILTDVLAITGNEATSSWLP